MEENNFERSHQNTTIRVNSNNFVSTEINSYLPKDRENIF